MVFVQSFVVLLLLLKLCSWPVSIDLWPSAGQAVAPAAASPTLWGSRELPAPRRFLRSPNSWPGSAWGSQRSTRRENLQTHRKHSETGSKEGFGFGFLSGVCLLIHQGLRLCTSMPDNKGKKPFIDLNTCRVNYWYHLNKNRYHQNSAMTHN